MNRLLFFSGVRDTPDFSFLGMMDLVLRKYSHVQGCLDWVRITTHSGAVNNSHHGRLLWDRIFPPLYNDSTMIVMLFRRGAGRS